MKKEEIDDRLMDALLRGESQEDLGSRVAEARVPCAKKSHLRKGLLAMAAMLAVAAMVIVLGDQNQKKEDSAGAAVPAQVIDLHEQELLEKDKVLSGQGSSVAVNVQEDIPSPRSKINEKIGESLHEVVSHEVAVVGAVHAPGKYPVRDELTLGDVLNEAGGLTVFGTSKRVTVYREGKRYSLNMLDNAQHRDERIYPGDVVEFDYVKSFEATDKKALVGTTSKAVSIQGQTMTDADFGPGWGGGGQQPSEPSSKRARVIVGREPQLQKQRQRISTEKYASLSDQPWKAPHEEALSTFSVDVDTASYTNVRRLLNARSAIPKDAVRIEELVNYFDYNYPQPENGEAFGVGLEMATCPWEPKHNLVRVALQGKELNQDERGDANLVFLIDVSGSMRDSDKLPLLVQSLGLMVEELQEKDSVAIVVYAGNNGLVLEPTEMAQGGREAVVDALGRLSAGGSTNGGAGIELAYRLARENFVKGGVNRVILATDGDFNVGLTGKNELVSLVKKQAEGGVFLSVCGLGRGNLNDSMLEAITNDGNGVYYYIDSIAEGRRVFLEKLMGTLVTIAKDVKVQVEFNPAKVGHYRLIGYANRVLKKEDFNNDKVDAGDIGSGHQVTAFYEIVPAGVTGTVRPQVDALKYQAEQKEAPNVSLDWMTIKLRHKEPEGTVSKLQEFVLKGEAKPWTETDADYRFASGVALWGMGLRQMDALQEQREMALALIGGAVGEAEERLELYSLLKGKAALPEGGMRVSNQTDSKIAVQLGKKRLVLPPQSEQTINFTKEQNEEFRELEARVYTSKDSPPRILMQTKLNSKFIEGQFLVFKKDRGSIRLFVSDDRDGTPSR